tara:strand:+ start:105 stop:329 length:225 start_codon:yes stop_codon:yes gene_type:complete
MKAHQRIIREQKQLTDTGGLFGYPQTPDIKTATLNRIDYNTSKQIIEEYEWLGTIATIKAAVHWCKEDVNNNLN